MPFSKSRYFLRGVLVYGKRTRGLTRAFSKCLAMLETHGLTPEAWSEELLSGYVQSRTKSTPFSKQGATTSLGSILGTGFPRVKRGR